MFVKLQIFFISRWSILAIFECLYCFYFNVLFLIHRWQNECLFTLYNTDFLIVLKQFRPSSTSHPSYLIDIFRSWLSMVIEVFIKRYTFLISKFIVALMKAWISYFYTFISYFWFSVEITFLIAIRIINPTIIRKWNHTKIIPMVVMILFKNLLSRSL